MENNVEEKQPRRRFTARKPMRKRRPSCPFCTDTSKRISYKDVESLRFFLTERGKIKPRRRAGTCAKHQRVVAREIKRARHLALIPFSPEHLR
ncbi:MAG: 30S ribosomal protein S18 [Chloroflexi bacterium]|nr:30S ribosomal protein S18 [Chloroflexota bacterium]